MNLKKESLKISKKEKLEVKPAISLKSKKDLSLAYTPGVGYVCMEIFKNKKKVYDYTIKKNCIGVITDGSAVLGLGNIGAEAGLPVMEGKAMLFKELAGINAFPICLNKQDTNKTIETIKNISPVFGGINLEDFKAPECFEIEKKLQNIGIPVMHDDQHATAVVFLAGLINSLKLRKSKKENVKIVVNGVGAAGTAIIKLLLKYGFKNIIAVDKEGILNKKNKKLNKYKKEIAKITNKKNLTGTLKHAIKNSDIFLGVSVGNILTEEMIKSMNKNPIIFATANPIPEIMPKKAKKAGAFIIATGRSDFENQVNNVLAFPGIFKGALLSRAKKITDKMKLVAAKTLADSVKNLSVKNILPNPLDKKIHKKVAQSVRKCR
jgi:malate dehydrogenase (oxaloacetate-decarboxylating)